MVGWEVRARAEGGGKVQREGNGVFFSVSMLNFFDKIFILPTLPLCLRKLQLYLKNFPSGHLSEQRVWTLHIIYPLVYKELVTS